MYSIFTTRNWLTNLKLIEEGKIRLEDDFRKYIPGVLKNIEDNITIYVHKY